MDILIGFITSLLISYGAYKKNSLSTSGFIFATILGTLIYFFGGIFFWILMIGFFISSSLLTKFKDKDKKILEEINAKTGARDYIQVMANGSLALFYSFLYYITKSPLYMIPYAVCFAAVNADTWSSEIGVLSKESPISILTFRKVSKGQSGAISLLGTLAGLLGSLFIGVLFIIGYVFYFGWEIKILYYFILIVVSGFAGSIIDSFLGATIQAKYRCKVCKKETENRFHHEKETIHIKGLKFMNNDAVNFLSSFIATILAYMLLK